MYNTYVDKTTKCTNTIKTHSSHAALLQCTTFYTHFWRKQNLLLGVEKWRFILFTHERLYLLNFQLKDIFERLVVILYVCIHGLSVSTMKVFCKTYLKRMLVVLFCILGIWWFIGHTTDQWTVQNETRINAQEKSWGMCFNFDGLELKLTLVCASLCSESWKLSCKKLKHDIL